MKNKTKIALYAVALMAVVCITVMAISNTSAIEKTNARYVSLVTAEETIVMNVWNITASASTIGLDKSGGTGGDNTVCIFADREVPPVEIPVKDNCLFLGYFDAENGGNMFYSSKGVPVCEASAFTAVSTLYAHWSSSN